MHNFNSLFFHVLLVLAYCGTINAAVGNIFDFKLTSDMKPADADVKTSALGKLIKFVVKGKDKSSEYLTIGSASKSKEVELGITIKDSSIFCPGDPPKPENCQKGFRRTDVLPAVEPTKAFTGQTVFHQSFRLNDKLPLDTKHGYLIGSVEIDGGNHVWDIFAGADFAGGKNPSPSKNKPDTIRIRDLTSKVLHTMPIKKGVLYNTAISVDWDANTLTVFASQGDEKLKKIIGPVKNDAKVKTADAKKTGEWHVQLIKFPTPDKKDSPKDQEDVPHKGVQPTKIHEGVFFSRVYVEDGKKEKITLTTKPAK